MPVISYFFKSDSKNKKILFLLIIAVIVSISPLTSKAQGLVDGFFRGKGNADATLSSTFESADEFYNADQKVDVPPFYKKLYRTSISLYVAYGLTDNIDLNLNVPYIIAKGDGQAPPPQDFNSFQDGALTIKWRPLRTEAGPGTFNLVAAGALSVPLADYENGEFPNTETDPPRPVLVAIGDRATAVSGALLAQYEFYSGLFTSVQGGYSIKGNTGNDLDVPNAALVSGKLGYAASKYYGAAWISGQFSTEGTDIGKGPFPTNQVDYTILGFTGSYSFIPSFSLNAAYFTTLDGRNFSDTNGFSVGITYKFGQ